MTTLTQPAIAKRIDAEVDRLIAERDALLRLPDGPAKNAHLADLFDHEASLWGELYDATSSATLARAAIRARHYARSEAARLRAARPQHPTRWA